METKDLEFLKESVINLTIENTKLKEELRKKESENSELYVWWQEEKKKRESYEENVQK